MRSITHRQNKLSADQKNTGETEDHEDVHPNIVSKGIELGIRQRSSNEVEGKVEVGLEL